MSDENQMQKQLDHAQRRLEEVLAANVRLLKERELIFEPKKPEPTRLEIAARIMQGWASNPNMEAIAAGSGERPSNAALRIADALILAAKEVHP